MRILQIISHYIPAHSFGGPLRVAHLLGKSLQQQGHQVTVITTNQADKVSNLSVPIGKPVNVDGLIVYYEATFFCRYWGFSPRLFHRIAEEMNEADIVFVHAHYQFSNWAGAWLARQAKKPYIIFSHGSLHREGISHKNALLKKAYLSILERNNLHKALFLAFNAKEEKDSSLFSEYGQVVPNGIDPNEFRDMPAPGLLFNYYKELEGKTIYLFLGRLDVEHKGLDLLIPAFSKLVNKYPSAHLMLAGPDEEGGEAKLHALVEEYQIEKHVTFTGLISGELKLAALQDADVFVMSSRFEGMSIAVLEALYMGMPVVVTNQVGLSDTIKNSRCGLVTPVSEDDVHEALVKLSNKDFRSTMKGNGTNLILENYTWDAIASDLTTRLRELGIS